MRWQGYRLKHGSWRNTALACGRMLPNLRLSGHAVLEATCGSSLHEAGRTRARTRSESMRSRTSSGRE